MRVRCFARGDVPLHAQAEKNAQTNEWILSADQGLTAIIDGTNVRTAALPGLAAGPTTLDISTDRLVIWTSNDAANPADFAVENGQPLEIYMEGNVVFRQGDRVIYADRMYYDVRNHRR